VHVEAEVGEVFHAPWSFLLEVFSAAVVDVGVVRVDVVGDAELCARGVMLLAVGVDGEVTVHPKFDFKKHGNGIHPPICFLFKCVS
jgi:hypothetical protein